MIRPLLRFFTQPRSLQAGGILCITLLSILFIALLAAPDENQTYTIRFRTPPQGSVTAKIPEKFLFKRYHKSAEILQIGTYFDSSNSECMPSAARVHQKYVGAIISGNRDAYVMLQQPRLQNYDTATFSDFDLFNLRIITNAPKRYSLSLLFTSTQSSRLHPALIECLNHNSMPSGICTIDAFGPQGLVLTISLSSAALDKWESTALCVYDHVTEWLKD